MSKNLELEVLYKQSLHWEENFSNRPDMFGTAASVAAVYALDQYKKNNERSNKNIFCKENQRGSCK